MENYRSKTMAMIGLFIVLTTLAYAQAAGPWCFACKDVFHPAICQSVEQCGEHEFCHTEKTLSNNGASLYTTSCKDVNLCKTRVKRAAPRSLLCDQCCNGTLCNAEGCGAPPIKTPQQLYCLHCDFVQNPADCDQVDVCSVDKVCSVSADKQFTFPFYKLGCRSKTSCPPPTATLAKDKNICCDTDLCNSNDLGISPALYTTTPIPTTRKPAQPTATFDNATLEYKVTHAPNEKMELLCHVTGGPVPTVTWTFDNGTGSVPVTSGISAGPNGDSILSIPDPDSSNSGTYTCNATNPLGSAQQDITVMVRNPPKIEGSLNNTLNIQFQGDATLDCNVTMDNGTSVHWVIPPTVKSYKIHPNNSLTIYNVHNENNADYLCVAENADGNTTKTFSISVNDTSSPQTSSAPPPTCPTAVTTPCPTLPTCTCPTPKATSCPTLPPCTCPTVTATPCPTVLLATMLTAMGTKSTQRATTTPPKTSTQGMNTLQTANASPTNPPLVTQNPNPSNSNPTHLAHDQFQSNRRQVNIMQCPTNGQSNVEWHRLVQDYDHSDPVYISNSVGVLTISKQMSILSTGVYQCSVGNVTVSQFVVYGELPSAVRCSEVFGDVSATAGIVIQAHCPPCQYPNAGPPKQPMISDFICQFAGSIPSSGKDVIYLVDNGGKVVLLNKNAGDIIMK